VGLCESRRGCEGFVGAGGVFEERTDGEEEEDCAYGAFYWRTGVSSFATSSTSKRRETDEGFSQDCAAYADYVKHENEPVDGFVLLGPVSDREGLALIMEPSQMNASLAYASRLIAQGKKDAIMPKEMMPYDWTSPVTAYRWHSLASVGYVAAHRLSFLSLFLSILMCWFPIPSVGGKADMPVTEVTTTSSPQTTPTPRSPPFGSASRCQSWSCHRKTTSMCLRTSTSQDYWRSGQGSHHLALSVRYLAWFRRRRMLF
jgi:hypothetical protein